VKDIAKAKEIANAIIQYKQIKEGNQLHFYKPYQKQKDFHAAGLEYGERCLGAGNQLGKTYCGSMEAAFHATGLYPDWWVGQRFSKANVGWVGGVSGEVIRDTTQKLLLGRIQNEKSIGTGSIPFNHIEGMQKAQGVPGLLDHAKIKHVSGGISLIFFKSYEKGREKFQGETIDWFWPDEEPPQDIYTEALTRTNNGQVGQFSFMTFTPLKGMTDVVMQFYQNPHKNQSLTMMTIEDVDHYSREEKDAIIASYPEHEREARTKGIPILGSGRIYPISESRIAVEPFDVPKWWPRIRGIDFGFDHPSALVDCMYDPDGDIFYVRACVKERQMTASQFSLIINKRNGWIPVSWPHDGLNHDKGSGKQLKENYIDSGVNMLDERATFENGSNNVEPGIADILDRMRTGRFKVFNTCENWLEEFRLYHRKDGKVVKQNDDALDATRYALMMIRYAVSENENDFDPEYENSRNESTGYW
jgi:phage terminase large subunit-like protein